jgi:hypothetical protein
MKWSVDYSKFTKVTGKYWIIPCISIWYDQYYFLETGVNTSAFGLQVSFFNFAYGLVIQKQ